MEVSKTPDEFVYDASKIPDAGRLQSLAEEVARKMFAKLAQCDAAEMGRLNQLNEFVMTCHPAQFAELLGMSAVQGSGPGTFLICSMALVTLSRTLMFMNVPPEDMKRMQAMAQATMEKAFGPGAQAAAVAPEKREVH